jgi:hypothetical protein
VEADKEQWTMSEPSPAKPPDSNELLEKFSNLLKEHSAELSEVKVLLLQLVGKSPNEQLPLGDVVKFMPPGIRSVSSLRRKIRQGKIPARKINGRYSVCPAEAQAALNDGSSAEARVRAYIAGYKPKNRS